MTERAAVAAVNGHAAECPRCRSRDEGCPEAAALYRAWRSARRRARDQEEVPREDQHV
ncbi:hypothetical protein ACQYWQ_03120 [Streptomyces sp. P6-2-1]|uniref:hypothetical protein n=1 Tax=unclassified Streptomyces TaxID=2593676 RepID=UPI003D36F2FE